LGEAGKWGGGRKNKRTFFMKVIETREGSLGPQTRTDDGRTRGLEAGKRKGPTSLKTEYDCVAGSGVNGRN